MKRYVFFLLCLLLLANGAQAQALKLITEDEARLPPVQEEAKEQVTRAITRGPGITLTSADTVEGQGFPLRIAFEPRGGVAIDPKSVSILYLKNPAVDLTERLKEQISPDGIEVPIATAPSGEHPLQVTVRDSNGRQSVKKIKLVVR
jgi:hypothetical protein